MPDSFKVSVIIPVYNAEKFLAKAVASANNLEEVDEIVLIEDQSPDNALKICQALALKYKKVKFFQHPDKGNHGAGASRNLGIQKATCSYIAFLDADDYYLENRFKVDKKLFFNHTDCDGVYSAVGTEFYSKESKQDFLDKGFGYQETLTLTDCVSPEELFTVLFHKHKTVSGEFHTNGITLKKKVFKKVGFFNTHLKLRQDIHLWRRLAGFCNLYCGEIKHPTAMRVIHNENRMTVKENHNQYIALWWKSLKKEFKTKKLAKTNYKIFEQAYFNYLSSSPNKWTASVSLFKNVFKYPGIIKEAYGVFDFNFWAVFGKNWLTLRVISLKNKFFNKK